MSNSDSTYWLKQENENLKAKLEKAETAINTALSRIELVSESEVGIGSWDCICNAKSWLESYAKDN